MMGLLDLNTELTLIGDICPDLDPADWPDPARRARILESQVMSHPEDLPDEIRIDVNRASARVMRERRSGRIVNTVMGCRNELNWLPSTMYATRMPIASANQRPLVVSWSCDA